MAGEIYIDNLPFSERVAPASSARLGLVVLASDYTLEAEFRSILSLMPEQSVELFHARIANSPNVTPQTLRAMGPLLKQTAETLLPGDDLDVVAYGCTSASFVLGPDEVNETLQNAKPGARNTNPASAAFAAMQAFGATRIAVLTPYRRDVNEHVMRGLQAGGLEIASFGSFNEERDPVVAMIDNESLESGIRTLLKVATVDAVFVSCTSIKMVDDISRLESVFGLPITSSNHAMAWHCLRLAGVEELPCELGQLFTRKLAN